MADAPDDIQYLDRDRLAWNIPIARRRAVIATPSSETEPPADDERDEDSDETDGVEIMLVEGSLPGFRW